MAAQKRGLLLSLGLSSGELRTEVEEDAGSWREISVCSSLGWMMNTRPERGSRAKWVGPEKTIYIKAFALLWDPWEATKTVKWEWQGQFCILYASPWLRNGEVIGRSVADMQVTGDSGLHWWLWECWDVCGSEMMGLGNELDGVGEREKSRGPGGHLAFWLLWLGEWW